MERKYVDRYGSPVNEQGDLLAHLAGFGSPEYLAFMGYEQSTRARGLTKMTADPGLDAFIARLEELREPIVDQGEREDAWVRIEHWRQTKANLERPRTETYSKHFEKAMAAYSRGFNAVGDGRHRIKHIRRAQWQMWWADRRAAVVADRGLRPRCQTAKAVMIGGTGGLPRDGRGI